jgi:hypothetical protein
MTARALLFGFIALALPTANSSAATETVPGTDLPIKIFELPEGLTTPSRDIRQVATEVNSLNSVIGRYPPDYHTEDERTATFVSWAALLREVRGLRGANGDTEQNLYLLSELYRQGHNLDVIGSAELAIETFDLCLGKYPNSVPCHFSASYFYLSVQPELGIKAEGSLKFLREHFAPEFHPEIERGWVYFYVYQQRVEDAIRQIDYYLSKVPDGRDAKAFMAIREQLLKGPLETVTD